MWMTTRVWDLFKKVKGRVQFQYTSWLSNLNLENTLTRFVYRLLILSVNMGLSKKNEQILSSSVKAHSFTPKTEGIVFPNKWMHRNTFLIINQDFARNVYECRMWKRTINHCYPQSRIINFGTIRPCSLRNGRSKEFINVNARASPFDNGQRERYTRVCRWIEGARCL